jgi:hypothetical protein
MLAADFAPQGSAGNIDVTCELPGMRVWDDTSRRPCRLSGLKGELADRAPGGARSEEDFQLKTAAPSREALA